MKVRAEQIENFNQKRLKEQQGNWNFFQNQHSKKGLDCLSILKQIQNLQIAIPSWALGAGGTRFGRFSFGGEPGNLEQKIDDVGVLHALTQSAGAISLHIPWDIPKDEIAIKQRAAEHGILFDAVNSNTFQDQANQKHSYKFGSLCHTDKAVRNKQLNIIWRSLNMEKR